MANTKKQEVEANVAIEEVKKADEKVKAIEIDRAAKRAEKQEKRLNWWGPFKYVGKGINAVENNPKTFGLGLAVGGPLGAAAAWGVKKGVDYFRSKSSDEVTEETTEEVAEEAPFNTEA
jgi:hypothetical protein